MSGLGQAPVGFGTPLGIGAPDQAIAPPTIAPQAARFLDPLTKDYTVGADGEYLRMPSLRQRVELALGTLKASSSVQQTAGLTLPDKIDGNYERRVRFGINSALAFLVTSGEMRVDAVTVIESRPGRSDIRVAFTDLLTGDNHSTTL